MPSLELNFLFSFLIYYRYEAIVDTCNIVKWPVLCTVSFFIFYTSFLFMCFFSFSLTYYYWLIIMKLILSIRYCFILKQGYQIFFVPKIFYIGTGYVSNEIRLVIKRLIYSWSICQDEMSAVFNEECQNFSRHGYKSSIIHVVTNDQHSIKELKNKGYYQNVCLYQVLCTWKYYILPLPSVVHTLTFSFAAT